jgi:prophage tail gpP-like protein
MTAAAPDHRITLIIGGQRFDRWTSVRFERSIDEFADGWSLSTTTRYALTTDPDIELELDIGDEVEAWWGEHELLRGWLDEVDDEESADSLTVGFAGRSRAGDLVDSSALHKGAWTQRSALEIAKDLVAPFGLTVVVGAPGIAEPLRRFAVDGEESVADCLGRLASQLGLRIRSTPRGDVEFWAPGSAREVAQQALQRGRNIRACRRNRSQAERFSDYVTRIQVPSDDETSGAAAAIAASVKDAGVLRYRPLRLQAETGTGGKDRLQRRAEWERNTRAGRSDEVEVDVYAGDRTWLASGTSRDSAGAKLWAPGMLVQVYHPRHGIDGQLLVKSVSLGYSGTEGYAATLSLTHPEAYQPELPPKAKKKKGGYSW